MLPTKRELMDLSERSRRHSRVVLAFANSVTAQFGYSSRMGRLCSRTPLREWRDFG